MTLLSTSAGVDTSVRRLLDVRAAGGRTAYVEGASGHRVDWAGVARRAAAWEQAATTLGVAPDGRWSGRAGSRARVGLLVADPLEMAAAVLGALASGVCVAPLDPASTSRELAGRAEVLGLSAVVGGTADLDERGDGLVAAGVDVWETTPDGLRCARRADPAAARPGPAPSAAAALILCSSGTSGTPKVIPLQADALVATAACVAAHHDLGVDDCGYSPLPLWHINGLVVGVLAALVGGHRLVLDRRFSASSYWDVVERHDVTWLNAVPAILSVLASRAAPPASVAARVGFARSASAPLAAATLERWEALTGIPVLETYGMTEAASQITAMPRHARRPGSVGVAVGVELRVVDGEGRPVPAGEVGAVEVRGQRIVHRYWGGAGARPQSRPACSDDGWLATGDLGWLDGDGYLTLVGRADDVINRGGEKVYPREIEEVLLADPDVDAAAVVGREDAVTGEVPVAYVVAARRDPTPAALVARLERLAAAQLSRHRRPAEILLVDSLPSGLNGKIRRAELRRAARS